MSSFICADIRLGSRLGFEKFMRTHIRYLLQNSKWLSQTLALPTLNSFLLLVVFGFEFYVLYFLIFGFEFWVLGFGFWVLGVGFWVLGFWFWVLGFWVLGFGFCFFWVFGFLFFWGGRRFRGLIIHSLLLNAKPGHPFWDARVLR